MKEMPFHSFCYSYYKACLMVMLLVYGSTAWDGYSIQIDNTITVDLNGAGNYETIQSAIDSICIYTYNRKLINQWILILCRIHIYNIATKTPLEAPWPIKPEVAARMLGDKYIVMDSSFDGFQDTLYCMLFRQTLL